MLSRRIPGILFGLFCLTLAACSGGGTETPVSPSPSTPGSSATVYPWSFDGTSWSPAAGTTPPACPSPVVLRTPVDLSMATSILYPGQVRTEYKPHGGFRFDRQGQSNDVTVVAPMDGMIHRGSRHIEGGHEQILVEVINPCGIMFRFDHLAELGPRLQQIMASVPLRAEDSRTTFLPPGQMISAGEVIGTRIGIPNNVGVDFGVYDLRQRNPRATRDGEFAAFGVCWFDWLPPADAATVRSLPGGDHLSGRNSDYCL